MNGIGNDIFAHPGFTEQKHRALQTGNFPSHSHHFFQSETPPHNIGTGNFTQLAMKESVVVGKQVFECGKIRGQAGYA